MTEKTTRDVMASLQERVVPAGRNRYGLVIGIERYRDTRLNLRCAVEDARAMFELMTDSQCGMFSEEDVQLLINEDATREQIWRALAGLRRKAHKNDSVWIFYAGHGAPEGDDFFWVPYDGNVDDLYATGLSRRELNRVVDDLHADRIVAFLDCCHAEAMAVQKNKSRSVVSADTVLNNYQGRGRLIFAASQDCEKSVELTEKKRGAFSYYLERGLRGEADEESTGIITADELWYYLKNKVSAASQSAGNPQTPVRIGEETHDFALSLNPLEFGRRKRIAEAIKRLVGTEENQLTTEEGRACLDLLRNGPKSKAEKDLMAELRGVIEGSMRIATLRRMIAFTKTEKEESLIVDPLSNLSESNTTAAQNQSFCMRKWSGAMFTLFKKILHSVQFIETGIKNFTRSYVSRYTVLLALIVFLILGMFVGLPTWLVVRVRAHHHEDLRVLTEAQEAVDAGNPDIALELLEGRKMRERNRSEEKEIKEAANRLRRLHEAESAAEEGNVPRVAGLVKRYSGDAEFMEIMERSLDIGEDKYTALAAEHIEKGDYLSAKDICVYYEGRESFDGMMEQARELAIEHIKEVAPEGDWESAKEASRAFSEDEGLASLEKKAKRIHDRPRLLEEAKDAASVGHVTTVEDIASDYPDDPEFADLIEKSEEIRSEILDRAEKVAEAGEVKEMEALVEQYPKEEHLQRLLDEALSVAQKKSDLEAAQEAARVGRVAEVELLAENYPGNEQLQEALVLARKEREKKEALEEAHALAEAGEVKEMEALVEQYPKEEHLQRLLNQALSVAQKKSDLEAAQEAARVGRVAEVELLAENYPGNEQLQEALSEAKKVEKQKHALGRMEEAVANLNLKKAVEMASNYEDSSEFQSLLAKLRNDSDYYYVLASELLQDTRGWNGRKVKLTGRIESKTLTSAVAQALLIIENGKLLCDFGSKPSFRKAVKEGHLSVGDTLTVWGRFRTRWGTDKVIIHHWVKGEGVDLQDRNEALINSKKALEKGEIEKAAQLASPWRFEKDFRSVTEKVEQARYDQQFQALPSEGIYTVVSGHDINKFSSRLEHKKIWVDGILLTDINQDRTAEFSTEDGLTLKLGVRFPERLGEIDTLAKEGLWKGALVRLWGVLKIESSFFRGVRWGVDPVDKWELREN